MRILVCHSRYRSGPASGENRVVDDEVELLNRGGHEVMPYVPTPEVTGKVDLLRTGAATVWSIRATRHLGRLMQKYRPDVVHFHNLFPLLSPASLRIASSRRSAVVMTLHNYRLMCLPGTLLRNGAICEACLGTIPVRGILYKCYQESALASGALAVSITAHRAIGSFDHVDRYLAISKFVRQKHIEAGIPSEKIRVKRHFAWPSERRRGPGSYFLFLGRLSEEKGVHTLLRAWPRNGGRLVVAGSGPEETRLRALASPSVDFLGTVSPEEAARLVVGARCLVVPSIWYEGAGRVVLEAYAAAVPVIASDMGGLSEVVSHNRSGLLFPASDETALRGAIERLLDPRESERLGEGALKMWKDRYRPEQALRELEKSYLSALGARDVRAAGRD
jgi:glycosyltransferase involved in cell wall biosynthesis